MFIKDMRPLYDIVQSPRPSNNLVYSRHVTFMFKVTFMLVLFQGKDNSYTVIEGLNNSSINEKIIVNLSDKLAALNQKIYMRG